MYGYGPLFRMHPFEFQLFLVTHMRLEAHATNYIVEGGLEGRFPELFPKYQTEISFLIGNNVYVYKEENFTTKYLYQNKQVMSFISNHVYFGGGTPMDEVDPKCLQRYIDIQLLMEAYF